MKDKAKTRTGGLEGKIREFKAGCREAGMKITPQRTAIYTELIRTQSHPTADALYKKVKKTYSNISLDTVNRTLLWLAKCGLAFIVEGTGQAKRYDGGGENHQHFLCVKCKRIVDFRHKPFENIKLPPRIENRFKVLRKTVYIEGFCDRCIRKKGN